MRAPSSQEVNALHLLLDVFDEKIVIPPCTFPDTRTLNRPSWGSSRNRRHAQHDMSSNAPAGPKRDMRDCLYLVVCISCMSDRGYSKHDR